MDVHSRNQHLQIFLRLPKALNITSYLKASFMGWQKNEHLQFVEANQKFDTSQKPIVRYCRFGVLSIKTGLKMRLWCNQNTALRGQAPMRIISCLCQAASWASERNIVDGISTLTKEFENKKERFTKTILTL